SAAQAASQRVESHSYDELQQRRGRPISPHVTNYRFPIAAISSITNRITGVALVGGLYGIGALSLVGVDAQHIMSVIHDSILAGPVKLVVTFPLIYHYFAAARHTIWDFYPETVENKSVEKSSLLIFAAAGSLSLAAACL
ncbi:transmembrane subunit of succinate dehydrogenase/Fumarate reductase, partial [Tribonema minus]